MKCNAKYQGHSHSYMKSKVILTDIDGVMLDWEQAFHHWIVDQGHILDSRGMSEWDIDIRYGLSQDQGRRMVEIFNQSAVIGFLPAFRDAQHYVSRLVAEGYRFIAITSMGTDPYAVKLRKRNLEELFGRDAFLNIHCLPIQADKREILEYYRKDYQGAVWIEDKPENADLGARLHYDAILMEHQHNRHADGAFTGVTMMSDWKTIYEYITDK